MANTPMSNRTLPSGKDKTPLGNRILPGKDRTPTGNRVLPGKALTKEQHQKVDSHLLALLRSLNLAIAQVSQARELRYTQPEAAIPPAVFDSTLQHLKEAQAVVEVLKTGR